MQAVQSTAHCKLSLARTLYWDLKSVGASGAVKSVVPEPANGGGLTWETITSSIHIDPSG
jgi:hypothetical protein